jgi:hypothetical protein
MDVYSQKEGEEFFRESDEHLNKGLEIFSGIVAEPIRLWEAYNELGSLYCDWAWLSRKQMAQNWRETALDQYDRSMAFQKDALEVAKDYSLTFQVVDSYDDLAQATADRSFLLADSGRLKEGEEGLKTADSYLDRILEIIPIEFHILKGKGFIAGSEPGEAFWLSLGKLHLQKGIWIFEQIKRNQILRDELDAYLRKSIRLFAISNIYFHQYWPQSHAYETGVTAFAARLQRAGVSSDLAKSIIREVAEEFAVNLDSLLDSIDDVLGIFS